MINKLTKEDIDKAGLITCNKSFSLNYKNSPVFPECLLLTIEVGKKLGGLQTIKNLWTDNSINWITDLRKRYGGDGLVGLEGHGWYKYNNSSPEIGDACVVAENINKNIFMYSVGFWDSENWMTVSNSRYYPLNMSKFSEVSRGRKKK